ncbi:MAG: hypothetical protein EU543_05820 [Promethearchaeota archaeon]|nr:MAG: hypothetical protein EU543_05820 [Candidatus Lokiarchaeota archaeon]
MNLLKEYKNLYDHWLEEFQNEELTVLSQNIFTNYKKFLEFIKNFEVKEKNEIKKEIIETYKQNVKFLFDDLLKMREIKIINYALTLEELDIDSLFEAEKLFFQNLIASIKGFQKVKSLSIYEDDKIFTFPEIKSVINEENLEDDETNPIENNMQETLHDEIIEEKSEMHEQISYKMIRFIKNTPALVGIDLLNYGPFKKEDIANIPQENAKILVNEKVAEFIKID